MSAERIVLLAAVALSGCAASGDPVGPSMAPVGDGLRFLGISAVVAVLVAVIGLSSRGGGS